MNNEDKFNEINLKLDSCETIKDRKTLQGLKDILMNTIEIENRKIEINTFVDKIKEDKLLPSVKQYYHYPYLTQMDFNQSLYDIKSINNLKYIKKSNDGSIRLKKSQEFVKLFLSNETGYNSLLIYHGVGVGKTCASISSIEPLKKQYKEVFILSPSLEDNWRDEIFNVNKELNKKRNVNVQCTGNTYSQLVNDLMPKPIYIQYNISLVNIKKLIDENKVSYNSFEAYSNLRIKKANDTDLDREKINLNSIKKHLNNHFENLKKKINKIIKKKIDSNYSFFGYLQFAKSILNNIDNLKYEYQKINFIKKQYSNCIFILDEIQVIKSSSINKSLYQNDDEKGEKKDDKDEKMDHKAGKKILEVLDYIVRYGDNNKLLLLSATPMYDTSTEIIQILNLLLLNDKKAPILINKNEYYILTEEGKKIIFDKQGSLTNDGIQVLKQKSIGYISYLKGNDPENFPKKLWPNVKLLNKIGIDIELYKSKNKFIDCLNDEEIENIDMIDEENLKIVEAYMEDEQMNQYIKMDNKSKGFKVKIQQLSNITFPKEYEYKDCIKENKGDTYTILEEGFLDDGSSFLEKNNLYKYSSKFPKIIDCINKSTGIVFINSRWLAYGIKILSLALELEGYREFSLTNNDNFKNRLVNNSSNYYRSIEKDEDGIAIKLDKTNRNSKKVAKYIILSGETKNKTELIRIARGEDKGYPNKNGESVKIILTNLNVGISFKMVRQIHVLNPWWHLNLLEQIIGRGIRNQSHDALDENLRNVTVFFYACSYKMIENEETFNGNKETFDEHMYRIAYIKDKAISEIEAIFRKNAIDCQLNKNSNTVKIDKNNAITEKKVIDTFNNNITYTMDNIFKKDNLYEDTDHDKTYKCIGNIIGNIPIKELTESELKQNIYSQNNIYNLSVIETKIKNIFNTSLFNYPKYSYKIEDIIVLLISYNINDIYLSLNNLIENQVLFSDIFGRIGYLIYNNGYYVFQPNNKLDYPNNMNDIKIPINIKNKLMKKYHMKAPFYKNTNYNEIKINTFNYNVETIDDEINLSGLFSFIYTNIDGNIPIYSLEGDTKTWYPNMCNSKSNKQIKKYLESHCDDKIFYYKEKDTILSLKDYFIYNIYSYINKSPKEIKEQIAKLIIKSNDTDSDSKYLEIFKEDKYQNIYIPKYDLEKEEWDIVGEKLYEGEYPILNLLENILENQGILIPKSLNYEFINKNHQFNLLYKSVYLKSDEKWKNNYLFFRIAEKDKKIKKQINQYIYNKQYGKLNIDSSNLAYEIPLISMNSENFAEYIAFNIYKDDQNKSTMNKVLHFNKAKGTREVNKGKNCMSYDITVLLDILNNINPSIKASLLCNYIIKSNKCGKITKKDAIKLVYDSDINIKNIKELCKKFSIPKMYICNFIVYYLITEQLKADTLSLQYQKENELKDKLNKTCFISNNYKFFTIIPKNDKIVPLLTDKDY